MEGYLDRIFDFLIALSSAAMPAIIIYIKLKYNYNKQAEKDRKAKEGEREKQRRERKVKDAEDTVFKESINKQISRFTKEYGIFLKQVAKYRKTEEEVIKSNKKLINSVGHIIKYVDRSDESKQFKHKVNKYSQKLLKASNIRDISLNHIRKGFADVASNVVKYGFNNIDYITLTEDLKDNGINCEESKIFTVDIEEIIKNNEDDERVGKYTEYCQNFVKKIIENYN